MRRKQCTPLVAIQQNSKEGKFLHVQVSCRRWTCPSCGPIRRWIVQQSLERARRECHLNYLLTLTLKRGVVSPEESPAYIQNCWKKFLILIRRKYGKIRYIAVKEFQQNGMAHFHILVDTKMSPKWVSRKWSAVGGGKIVDFQEVDNEFSPKYLTKYLTKQLPFPLPKRYRKVAASRGIVLYPKMDLEGVEIEWKIGKADYDMLASEMRDKCIESITRLEEEVGFIASSPAKLMKFHQRRKCSSKEGKTQL